MSTDSTLARPATESAEIPVRDFVRARLPWAVAGGALLLYLLTLQYWVSLHSLSDLARISGWTWSPEISSPLYWLVTLPVTLLPAGFVPLALNLLAAVVGSLILALLARSVSLLPHDRTRAQRERERGAFYLFSAPTAWIPPVLAAVVLGLQLTFWECSTANLRRMLELLLFAYVIRCVLEYRIDERESWLTRASLVYGLGMANDWAMVGFFPAFLIALVWVKGIGFFESRFLLRMFGWGIAGVALYLVLPIFYATQHIPGFGFWANIKREFVDQKNVLIHLPFSKQQLMNPDNPLVMYGMYSLLPVFLMGIRWPSTFGDTSATGAKASRAIFHVVHLMFLFACAWILLDPPVSPRNRGANFGLPFLTLYYLAALSVGYFSGYALLVFGRKPSARFGTSASGLTKLGNNAAVGAVFAVLICAPLILLYRNLPQIRLTNGSQAKQYASMLVENLPASGAVLLSDTSARLLLARAFLEHENRASNYLFVDTGSLPFSTYHRLLKRRYADRWPVDIPAVKTEGRVPDLQILSIIAKLAKEKETFYLHPSFGYYFEVLRLEPQGLIYRLRDYAENALLPPPLTQEQLTQNEAFWTKAEKEIFPSVAASAAKPLTGEDAGVVQKVLSRLHLEPEANRQAQFIGSLYAQPLVYWGAQLQKATRPERLAEPTDGKVFNFSARDLTLLTNAAAHFEMALELNPRNLVAQLNLEANKQLKAERSGAVPPSKEMEEGLGKYQNILDVSMEQGPFDEANRCYQSGVTFALGLNHRQAKQQLLRADSLDPGNMEARLAMAGIDLPRGEYTEALQIVNDIRGNPKQGTFRNRHETDLLFIEASAQIGLTNEAGADRAIQAALQTAREAKDDERQDALAGVALTVYMNSARYTNALKLADEHLKQVPNSIPALSTKGFLSLQMGSFQQAIDPLSRVINLEKSTNVLVRAHLNRAIAYFRTDNLDGAKADYNQVLKLNTNIYQAYYGLAEIAYQKKEKPEAIKNLKLYLTNAPAQTAEADAVAARLKELSSAP